jgi:hypothetical protein
MILNTWYQEEVNGCVVGPYMLTGTLRYDGRQQGEAFYCETETQLLDKAKSILSEIKRECGPAFDLIYTKDVWELRIHYA